ncbi:MAG TPA: hypothetical protein VJ957_10725 [Longimicrobiales bacterium]|nr:hypothetical protein [Longimicrobiales bacterium]
MTDERRPADEAGMGGPVPVRASMGADAPETNAPSEAPSPGVVKRFRHGDEAWLARVAGESAYGTGGRGTAYLVAVHFFRADDDATPLKEALIPAALFRGLAEPELGSLLESAVAIDLDREPPNNSRTGRRPLGGRSGRGRSSGGRS